DRKRYMYKIRLHPPVRQPRLWHTDDLDNGYKKHQPSFAGGKHDDMQAMLAKQEPWFEDGEVRREMDNRGRMGRVMTGDDNFDVHYWLPRLENMPENRLEMA